MTTFPTQAEFDAYANVLESIKEGDQVIIRTRHGYKLDTVAKVTPKLIVTRIDRLMGDTRYWRSNGNPVGARAIGVLLPATPENMALYRAQEDKKSAEEYARKMHNQARDVLDDNPHATLHKVGRYLIVEVPKREGAPADAPDAGFFTFKQNEDGVYKWVWWNAAFASIEDAFAAIAGKGATDSQLVGRMKLLAFGGY